MAPKWTLFSLLLPLMLRIALAYAVAEVGKCGEEDLVIQQRQVSRGKHERWRVEVSSKCEACEASVVELRCPGWVEGKAIEGYMYPVELVSPDLCLLGAPITAQQPFTAIYRQPAGKINLSVASVRFSCPASYPGH